MSKIFFITGLMLITAWVIGFIGFHVGGIIHILPVIAAILLLIRLFYNKSVMKQI